MMILRAAATLLLMLHIIITTLSFLRNQKKESNLANALTQWRKVEAALSAKDAEYTKLLSENSRLNDNLSDLQGQLENVRTRRCSGWSLQRCYCYCSSLLACELTVDVQQG